MGEELEDFMENNSDSYLTYDGEEWLLYVGLNINHGVYDDYFVGASITEALENAREEGY